MFVLTSIVNLVSVVRIMLNAENIKFFDLESFSNFVQNSNLSETAQNTTNQLWGFLVSSINSVQRLNLKIDL